VSPEENDISGQIRTLGRTVENLRLDVVDNTRGLGARIKTTEDAIQNLTTEVMFLRNHLPQAPSTWTIVILVALITGIPSMVIGLISILLR